MLRVARQGDDAAFEGALVTLVGELGAAGVVTGDVAARSIEPTPRTYALLWRAMRPMIERFHLAPSVQELTGETGVTPRQIDRYVKDFVTNFGHVVGAGWRTATRHLRLRLAVVLLSAEGASVADVATAVGYGSIDAMGRAFREIGLPAPSAIHAALRPPA